MLTLIHKPCACGEWRYAARDGIVDIDVQGHGVVERAVAQQLISESYCMEFRRRDGDELGRDVPV